MADKKKSGGVSLRTADAFAPSGLFGPGRATIVKARWSKFEYLRKGQKPGQGKTVNVLLVEYERDGEKEKVPYGIGKGWKIIDNGLRLEGRNGQTSLPNNCNAFYFFEALENADEKPMPSDYLDTPDQLDGADVELIVKPVERDFRDRDKKDDKESSSRKDTVLVAGEVYSAPWAEDEGKGKKKKKAKDEDEEEDSDDDDDDKPAKKKAKGKSDDDDEEESGDDDSDDDDEEEEKPKAKAKGKKKSDDDEEEEESDSDSDDDDEKPAKKKKASADEEDKDEAAIEALTDLLEAEESVLVTEIESKLLKRLKKSRPKDYDEIAERAGQADLLDQEKGWVRKGKKVTLDKD